MPQKTFGYHILGIFLFLAVVALDHPGCVERSEGDDFIGDLEESEPEAQTEEIEGHPEEAIEPEEDWPELPSCTGIDHLPSEPPIPGIPGQIGELPAEVDFTTGQEEDRFVVTGGGLEISVAVDPFTFTVSREVDGAVLLTSTKGNTRHNGFGPVAFTKNIGEWSHFLSTWWQYEGRDLVWSHGVNVVQICEVDNRVILELSEPEERGRLLFAVGPFYDGAVRIVTAVAPTDPQEEQLNRIALTFESPQDERYVGFGERFNSVDQRGRTVPVWSEEGGINPGDNWEFPLCQHA